MEKNSSEKQSLNHFAENKYSRTEYREVKEWFSKDEDSDLKESLKKHWAKIPADQDLSPRLINLLQVLITQISFTRPTKRWSVFSIYQKVAAVLFVPLVLGVIAWSIYSGRDQQMAMVTIHSTEGARTEFVLPDGSKGWLNSGSELTYPAKFTTNREIQLEGEAFFNVVHQNGEKFRVKTLGLTVQVLGTSFDVSAYKNDPEISVILKEGSVQVLNENEKPIYLMKPDERLNFNIHQKVAEVSHICAAEQILWTDGILQFRGEPMSEVMKKLGRWYNVDIEIRDKQLQKYNFKATFKNEQLEEILRMMALTTPMNYRIEERIKDENGIYKRKKIVIEKK